jgi:hypothetical protein
MSSGPKHYSILSPAVSAVRALLVTILGLSFFATVVPLSIASSAEAGLMACCIGKPGHESGSCSSGLLQPTAEPQPEPELSSDDSSSPGDDSNTAVGDTESEEGSHCNLHASAAGDVTSDAARQSETATPSRKADEFSFVRIHALSTPCSSECGPCSVSYTRRPRPREQATNSSVARPHFHLTNSLPPSEYPPIKPLNMKWVQLRPRAPPERLS